MFTGNGPTPSPSDAPGPSSVHMPNYGFVIDNRKCIGCHACSVACKAENEVPLGVNRTWVKNVEVGQYPDVRRHFQVTRCNHCANPPCVRICPTAAMYQRPDGIVEFNSDACIGCKACLQACPYDAIYIDPESRTAAKCHYCAHRTEIGLEPACVVVCPEHAIVSGDLADPHSEISRLVATHPVTVRKPEQGTAPKLFYIDGHDVAMHPTATERAPTSFAFADVIPLHAGSAPEVDAGANASRAVAGGHVAPRPLPWPQAQGLPNAGPIHVGGQMAGQMVQQVTYNAQHKVPWHWPVPAYLVTKAVAAGLAMVAVIVGGIPAAADAPGFAKYAVLAGIGVAALVFLAVTVALLVLDLERPERFLLIVLRPQWRSWLTRGAFVLMAFGAVTAAWTAIALGMALGWPPAPMFAGLVKPLLILDFPLAAIAAAYTGYLFAQAEGRDLWQSPLLPLQLVIRAVIAGVGVLPVVLVVVGMLGTGNAFELAAVGGWMLALVALPVALGVHLLALIAGESLVPVASEGARQAAHAIHSGAYARWYWLGAIFVGHVVPIGLLYLPVLASRSALVDLQIITASGAALAALAVLIGLFALEYAFVMAPQEIPNS